MAKSSQAGSGSRCQGSDAGRQLLAYHVRFHGKLIQVAAQRATISSAKGPPCRPGVFLSQAREVSVGLCSPYKVVAALYCTFEMLRPTSEVSADTI